MATSVQIIALLKSHIDKDDARFYALAMQVAAYEAKRGHKKLAREIQDLIDEAKRRSEDVTRPTSPTHITKPRGELSDLLSVQYPKTSLHDMVLASAVKGKLERIIREHRMLGKIEQHGLTVRRKLLLVGPPGTGKTMSAGALAGELDLPLFLIRLDGLFTRYLGETAAKLRLVFDAISRTKAVYLFDEFDAIGSQRGIANDVGEVRRVLNSFLQFIEQDQSQSLVLAATNHVEILDIALFRRFDDVIEFSVPDPTQITDLLRNRLISYSRNFGDWDEVSKAAVGLSYAELTRACEETIKDMILSNGTSITLESLVKHITERRQMTTR